MRRRKNLQRGASSRAVLALVLGILSWFTCGPLLGIPAWYLGSKEQQLIASGYSESDGKGIAQAGKILGMLNTILSCCGAIAYGILLMLGLATSFVQR